MLVFLLTFIVMLAFQPLLKKYFPQPLPRNSSRARPRTRNPGAATAGGGSCAAWLRQSALRRNVATKQAASETETVIENDLYRITFTNRGAQVKSWILKKFDNDAQNGPLDLVNPAAAAKYGYPLSLWTYDESSARAAEFGALRGFARRTADLADDSDLRIRRPGSCRCARRSVSIAHTS